MRTSSEHDLLLAACDMPAPACALLQALAAARGWRVRCDARPLPRVRSGEVVVAMAPPWLAVPRAQRPRGVLLLVPAGAPTPAADAADVVQPWPCDAAGLLDPLCRLMAPAPLRLDAVTRTVSHRGQLVHLTPKECRILQALLAHVGEAVARDALEATLHAWGQEFESNTLDVHVHRLRRKLPDAGIRAVRGFGYVLIAQR